MLADNDIHAEAGAKLKSGLASLRAADTDFVEAFERVEIMSWPGNSQKFATLIGIQSDALVEVVEYLLGELEHGRD